jgi:ABC-2 type transport system permease protein
VTVATLVFAQGGLELKQFFRARDSVVFMLLFPVILTVVFATVFSRVKIEDAGISLAQYFVTGMIAAGIMTMSFQEIGVTIPMERDRGILKRYRITPMPRLVYFAGKVIRVLVLSTVSVLLILAVSVAFYGIRLPDTAAKWATFGWVFLLGLVSCTLIGIAFSSIVIRGRSAGMMVNTTALILMFISGVYIQFSVLPAWVQHIAAIFPLKWMTQGLRSVFLPDSARAQEVAQSWELGRVALVLSAWCVIGLALCLLTFRWTSSRDG